MAKIYTKVGDKGGSSLVGGQKISKADLRLEAYGTVDELNSVLGFTRASLDHEKISSLDSDLELIQNWLFDLGSLLAATKEDRDKYRLTPITQERILFLEQKIDEKTAELRALKNFILPAGAEPSVRLHLARTVSRRAERAIVRLENDLPDLAVPFINRLSDYFFVMARWVNHRLGFSETEWKKS